MLTACLKNPERGGVVFDQPQQATDFIGFRISGACCGWSATQPRSFFSQALTVVDHLEIQHGGIVKGRLKRALPAA